MGVVIPPQEPDKILDTLDTVRVWMVYVVSIGILYIHAEIGAGGLNTMQYSFSKCNELDRVVPEVLLLPIHPS